jgi:N-methylhydantoinase A/oxoprolinase/acetone carboxylase beta subunit
VIAGLDVGGTNVDAALFDRGRLISRAKVPTDTTSLFDSVWSALEQLLGSVELTLVERINLSTTLSTNAIVEGTTDPVCMFIESGPGIDPTLFSCGDAVVYLEGSVDHRGREIKPFDPEAVKRHGETFSAEGMEHAGVVTKFCTRNPEHERQLEALLKPFFSHITMGHTVSGNLNFPRRIATAYLNSAVHKRFSAFAKALSDACSKKGMNPALYMLKADGGTLPLHSAVNTPVFTIHSGPTASVSGACALSSIEDDALLLDVGGTTTDIAFLVDGVPLFEPYGISVGSSSTLVRAVYSHSIALGGDSTVSVENGELRIGPRRAGSPRALGGPLPTPTDAFLSLGRMEMGDKTKALEAMKVLGQKLGLSAHETAQKIAERFVETIRSCVHELLEEINARPVYTIRELLFGKKVCPRMLSVIGGPAKAVSPLLEEIFGWTCVVPEFHEIANAVGAALSRTTLEITLIADTAEGYVTVPEVDYTASVGEDYTLEEAEMDAIEIASRVAREMETGEEMPEAEVTERSSFNMVRGFSRVGRRIRVKAQIRPGILFIPQGGHEC